MRTWAWFVKNVHRAAFVSTLPADTPLLAIVFLCFAVGVGLSPLAFERGDEDFEFLELVPLVELFLVGIASPPIFDAANPAEYLEVSSTYSELYDNSFVKQIARKIFL